MVWISLGGGQLIALVLGLGELCSIAPASSPYEARNKGWDRFSGIHRFGTGSFTSPQAHSTVLTQTRCRGHYPKYCSLWGTGTALPLLWPQGQLFHRPQVMRGRGSSSPCPLPNVADEGHIQVSHGHVLRLTHSSPISRVSSTVLHTWGSGPAFPVLQLITGRLSTLSCWGRLSILSCHR